MRKKSNLPITEEIDFAYLLSLLPPLKDEPNFQWLAELFSIIGHESLIDLCRYCGGAVIQIPTLKELSDAIDSLQLFYDYKIKKCITANQIPKNKLDDIRVILDVYNSEDS